MSDWRSEARQRVKEKSEGDYHKMAVGTNCMRVLPDAKDILPGGKMNPKGVSHRPQREIRMHYGVGPDETAVRCGKDIHGAGECWLCDEKLPELAKRKPQVAQRIEPKDQLIVNASRYDPETQKFGPSKQWQMGTGGSNSLGLRILSRISSSKKDYIDPNKGYNINIERTGEGMKTRYPEIDADDSPTKVPASVLATVKDLDTIIPAYDPEEQQAAFYGRARDDEDEERGNRKGSARRASSHDEETPDEEDSEPESEEEPEEESETGDESEEEEALEEFEAEPEEEPELEEEIEEESEEIEEELEEEEPEPPKKPATKKPVPVSKSKPTSISKGKPAVAGKRR